MIEVRNQYIQKVEQEEKDKLRQSQEEAKTAAATEDKPLDTSIGETVDEEESDNTNKLIFAGIGLSLLAIGGYFFMRKKQQQQQ